MSLTIKLSSKLSAIRLAAAESYTFWNQTTAAERQEIVTIPLTILLL